MRDYLMSPVTDIVGRGAPILEGSIFELVSTFEGVPLWAIVPDGSLYPSWMDGRSLALVLWVGLAILSLSLLILMRTRWGQAQPLSKCVALSVLAHLLFATYAYTTQLFVDVPLPPQPEVIPLRLVAELTEPLEHRQQEEMTEPKPWDRYVSESLPEIEVVGQPERARTPAEAVMESQARAAAPDFSDVAEVDPGTPAMIERPRMSSPVRDASRSDRSALEAPEIEVPKAQKQADPLPVPEYKPLHRIRAATTEMTRPERNAADPRLPQKLLEVGARVQRLAEEAADEVADALADSREDGRQATNGADVEGRAVDPRGGSDAAAETALVRGGMPSPPTRLGDGRAMPGTYHNRFAEKVEVRAAELGNTAEAEAGVAAALAWLAAHQGPDGSWNAAAYGGGRETKVLGHDRSGAGADADTAVTGLALLAMLGAGNTHYEGQYRRQVQHGLEFLISSQARDGNLAGNARLFARMYCHSMASLAISEAYALTGDHRLLPFVQRAISYSLQAQDTASGGWRYQPGDEGDMSQFGWKVMALRSAQLADVPVPTRSLNGMRRFLESCCRGSSKGLASYRPGHATSRAMTAEALACRFFLEDFPSGAETEGNSAQVNVATVLEAAEYLSDELPGDGQVNLYYWYYATLALHQAVQSAQQHDSSTPGGNKSRDEQRVERHWQLWSQALQNELLQIQVQNGADAGSWNPDCVWGSYGGRVYATALGALCLESYYRYQ